MRGVRSVVSSYGIHGAVGKRNQQCFAVGGGAQRRIHFVIGVVLANIFINQCKVVRSDFAGYLHPVTFAAAHRLQRFCG